MISFKRWFAGVSVLYWKENTSNVPFDIPTMIVPADYIVIEIGVAPRFVETLSSFSSVNGSYIKTSPVSTPIKSFVSAIKRLLS